MTRTCTSLHLQELEQCIYASLSSDQSHNKQGADLLCHVSAICQLTGSLVGLEQAFKEDKVILATAHLNSWGTDLLHPAFFIASLQLLLWLGS